MYQRIAININSFGLRDIADPTVVRFNGAWYLYAGAMKNGNPGCATGTNTSIFGFISYDAVNWSILNGGNPVITQPNTGIYGIGHPSAVAMNNSWNCSAGALPTWTPSPHILLLHTHFGLEPNPSKHMYVKRSSDGVNFLVHQGRDSNGVITLAVLSSSSPNLIDYGWWPSLKKVGQVGGDYPLVLSYTTANTQYTAASVTGSPFIWQPGTWGYGNGLPFAATATTTAVLESTPDGALLDTGGSAFYGAPTGQVNFRWSGVPANIPPSIYLGSNSTAKWFPWSTGLQACP